MLSIAIPTFNRAEKLDSQLVSLHDFISKSQFSKNIELLVVDNCSTDSSQKVIQAFHSIDRDYIFSSHQNLTNLGAERNFGQGILRSQGRFAWLLSDDDIVHEGAIDHIFSSLSENMEAGFCFVNYVEQGGNAAITIGDQVILVKNLHEYISKTMFAESMITACIYRKSLLSEETLTTMREGPFQYMYWVADIIQNHFALVIPAPLFTIVQPSVKETRDNANKRENTTDFYLEAHLDYLKYTSYVSSRNLGFLLRLKIHRLMIDENLNQVIFHKTTTDKLGYKLSSLKLALPKMIRAFYFSPSFWLLHIPLLLLPSFFAKLFAPLRWKILKFRAFGGISIRKLYNFLR